ncbi:DUF3293 domain-containing protein [Vibrio navarrensis]|nr:DUF3293 domain-containing protein [Vibrio navarrensis]
MLIPFTLLIYINWLNVTIINRSRLMIKIVETGVDAQLWHAYSHSFFAFTQSWTEDNYAIITAWNPGSVLLSNERNCINNQRLKERLMGMDYCPVLVGNQDFTWSEASFAVKVDMRLALDIAKEFQQNAIYYIENKELFLVSCFADETKQSLGSIASRLR